MKARQFTTYANVCLAPDTIPEKYSQVTNLNIWLTTYLYLTDVPPLPPLTFFTSHLSPPSHLLTCVYLMFSAGCF